MSKVIFSRTLSSCIKLNVNAVYRCETRFTHILKRKTKQSLPKSWYNSLIVGPFIKEKIKYKEPRPVADFIFDYVEQDEDRPLPLLRVLLLEMVDELGVPGDVVEVERNRARFELILPRLATYASPYNLKKYKHLIEMSQKERKGPSSPFSRTTQKLLEKDVIEILVNDKVEWTITALHVSVALRNAGYYVPEYAIELPKTPITGPDIAGKEGYDFAVFVTINYHERVPVRCCIHHNGRTLKPNWFRAPRKVLLTEEQGPLLESMPVHEAVEEEEEVEEYQS